MITADVLVIGSGVAGLSFALKIAEEDRSAKILVVTKAETEESNTKYAQGGIAVVVDQTDSFEKHMEDTIIAGGGVCDEDVVRMVVSEAPQRLEELIEWGAQFDVNAEGFFDLGKEGGHGENRIVHHKDITGLEIEEKLLRRITSLSNIQILDHHFAIDLITEHHLAKPEEHQKLTCYGAYIFDEQKKTISTVAAKVTMLASGGLGQVYAHTTNPIIATGDGVGMAYRAKARIADMEYVQFHPTALYNPGASPTYLISEAVRGFGAYLKTKSGDRFMQRYDDRMELASRDIVAKAIDSELKISGNSCVYLDCTHIDQREFQKHFPNISKKCFSIGVDVSRDWIPVVPAVHYSCGGVVVDHNGETEISNLYTSGETSRTGLHGANRLASNSLLEALVYSSRSFEKVKSVLGDIQTLDNLPEWDDKGTISPKERVVISHNRRQLQAIMSDYVGIVKTHDRLERARSKVYEIYLEVEELYAKSKVSIQLCELRNLITVAHLIISQSINQTTNRGVFFNLDLQDSEKK